MTTTERALIMEAVFVLIGFVAIGFWIGVNL